MSATDSAMLSSKFLSRMYETLVNVTESVLQSSDTPSQFLDGIISNVPFIFLWACPSSEQSPKQNGAPILPFSNNDTTSVILSYKKSDDCNSESTVIFLEDWSLWSDVEANDDANSNKEFGPEFVEGGTVVEVVEVGDGLFDGNEEGLPEG